MTTFKRMVEATIKVNAKGEVVSVTISKPENIKLKSGKELEFIFNTKPSFSPLQ